MSGITLQQITPGSSGFPFRTLGTESKQDGSGEPEPIEAMTATAIDEAAAAAAAKEAEEKEREKAGANVERRVIAEVAAMNKKIEKQHEQAIKQAEAAETRQIVRKVNTYLARFDWLRDCVPRLRANPSLEEARDALNAIHDAMMSQGSVKSLAQMLNHFFTMIEIWWGDGQMYPSVPPQLRFNLKGVSQLFREGKFPELDPLLMEIDIEYPWLGRRSLPARFAETLLTVLLKVHTVNTDPRARQVMQMNQQAPLPVNLPGDDDI